MERRYVLDANALLDYVDDGPGAKRMEQLLLAAQQQDRFLLMSLVNWGEVVYTSWQAHGEDAARRLIWDLSRLPIELLPADQKHVLKAAEIKARHKIPYADCFAAATAILEQAILVTADRDFEKLGRTIEVLWLSRP